MGTMGKGYKMSKAKGMEDNFLDGNNNKKKERQPATENKGIKDNEKKGTEKIEGKIGVVNENKLIDKYSFINEGIKVNVRILSEEGSFVPRYELSIHEIAGGTKLVLETKLRAELVADVKLDISEILDPKKYNIVKAKFLKSADKILEMNFPDLKESSKKVLSAYLVQNTLGLGEIENLIGDEQLEEIAVNNSREHLWVYHKKYGWCRTNLKMKSEELTYDYASTIGRKVGRQINTLNPMLDAHLPNGDRVNATLFPISNFGNTLTIRKFSRNPWTITGMIENKMLSSEVAALIWLSVQNELSLLISGGTGSGKTSFLNALSGLIPANQRIISIEDTRELTLPSFLHWVPMVTREPNPEGKGKITMLDLMVNALRQRPDRIIVGEVRRKEEAEMLFEAIHTGHSVYATLHADNGEQTVSRLTNPPLDIPKEMLDALAGVIVTFRHRRFGMRRLLEFSEIGKNGKLNTLYKWDIRKDILRGVNGINKISELLSLYAGMSNKEIMKDVEEKMDIFDWMIKNKYLSVDNVGEIISSYYLDSDKVVKMAKKNKPWIFGVK